MPGTKQVRYLDGGGGRAPKIRSRPSPRAQQCRIAACPPATPVPGAVAKLDRAQPPAAGALGRAIGYARDGLRSPRAWLGSGWRKPNWKKARRRPQSFKPDKVLRNPDLARTLEAIAHDGWSGFYDGARTRALVRQRRLRKAADLKYRPRAGNSRWSALRGNISNALAPTQGFAVLEMLNLLELLGMKDASFLGPDSCLVIRPSNCHHDRDRHLADRASSTPMARDLQVVRDERRALMDRARHPVTGIRLRQSGGRHCPHRCRDRARRPRWSTGLRRLRRCGRRAARAWSAEPRGLFSR